ncbi:MAG: oligopeptide/dipeptide ABC transporter ATP-binding protein [Nocardioidaceae bacterium]
MSSPAGCCSRWSSPRLWPGDPKLLLADEATTALDVTTQAEVVALLQGLAAKRRMGILFVTHDLELAAAMCDRVYVMYAGEIVESQPVDDLFSRPAHPYTAALLAATPRVEGSPTPPLAIAGRPLGLGESVPGCPFAPRCPARATALRHRLPHPERFGNPHCLHP